MDCKIFVLSSVTYAFKAKSILESRGIISKIEKVKNVAAIGGCGYGVKVNEDDYKNAQRFLAVSGIKIIEISDCEAGR